MRFEIKHRWNGSIVFALDLPSGHDGESVPVQLAAAVKAAIESGAALAHAALAQAALADANLRGARLFHADLAEADLTAATLAMPISGTPIWRALVSPILTLRALICGGRTLRTPTSRAQTSPAPT